MTRIHQYHSIDVYDLHGKTAKEIAEYFLKIHESHPTAVAELDDDGCGNLASFEFKEIVPENPCSKTAMIKAFAAKLGLDVDDLCLDEEN